MATNILTTNFASALSGLSVLLVAGSFAWLLDSLKDMDDEIRSLKLENAKKTSIVNTVEADQKGMAEELKTLEIQMARCDPAMSSLSDVDEEMEEIRDELRDHGHKDWHLRAGFEIEAMGERVTAMEQNFQRHLDQIGMKVTKLASSVDGLHSTVGTLENNFLREVSALGEMMRAMFNGNSSIMDSPMGGNTRFIPNAE